MVMGLGIVWTGFHCHITVVSDQIVECRVYTEVCKLMVTHCVVVHSVLKFHKSLVQSLLLDDVVLCRVKTGKL